MSGEKERGGGFLRRVFGTFGSDNYRSDDESFAGLEMLEPRVLLSANPFSEVVDAEAGHEGDYAAPAIYLPLQAGAQSVATQSADVEAPVITGVTTSPGSVQTFTNTYFTIAATDNVKVTRYQLTVNGQAVSVNATTGTSSAYKFTEPGTYTIEAKAFDAAGNVGTYTYTLEVAECPDLLAPSVVIAGFSNGSAYNRSISITATVNDRDSTEVNWTVRLINNATGEEELLASGNRQVSNLNIATISPANYAEGRYTVIMEAVDKAGHRSEGTYTFIIDTTPPELTIEHTGRLETDQVIWFTVAAEDENGITANRSLTINGVRVTLDSSGRGKYTFANTGTYTLVATAQDKAGNVSTVTRNIAVAANTDFAAPVITINSPAVNSYHKASINVSATVTDIDSDYITWTVRVRNPANGQVVSSATGTGKNVVASNLGLGATTGIKTIEVEATDPAGNTTIVTISINAVYTGPQVRLDDVPPDYSTGGGSWINTPKSITGTITAGDVPIEHLSWILTATRIGTTDTIVLATGTGQPENGIFGMIAASMAGKYTLALEVADPVGNTAKWSRNVNVDMEPPQARVTALYSVGEYWNIYIEGSDNVSDSPIFTLRPVAFSHEGVFASIGGPLNQLRQFGGSWSTGLWCQYEVSVSDNNGNTAVIGRFTVTKTEGGLIIG